MKTQNQDSIGPVRKTGKTTKSTASLLNERLLAVGMPHGADGLPPHAVEALMAIVDTIAKEHGEKLNSALATAQVDYDLRIVQTKSDAKSKLQELAEKHRADRKKLEETADSMRASALKKKIDHSALAKAIMLKQEKLAKKAKPAKVENLQPEGETSKSTEAI
jgi:hypothetical protein